MAPKRKLQVQHEGPEKKKGRQGAEEEDSFRSIAEALKAAPTEKCIAQVDPSCPLSGNPGIQVSCSPQPVPMPAPSWVQGHSDLLPTPLALARWFQAPKKAVFSRDPRGQAGL